MWELWVKSLIWGKMRTAAWRTEPQMALRDCSTEAVGGAQYIRFWWRGSSMQSSAYFTKGFLLVMRSWCHHKGCSAFLDVKRCKEWGHAVHFWKLKTCSTSFPRAQSASLHPEFSRVLKVNSCNSTGFNLCRGRWQMPLASANLQLTAKSSFGFFSIRCYGKTWTNFLAKLFNIFTPVSFLQILTAEL